MNKVTTFEYQNLLDVSIQECGGIESVFDLALLNGKSITDEPVIGTKILVPETINNREIADFFKKKAIRIATTSTGAATLFYAVPEYVGNLYWE